MSTNTQEIVSLLMEHESNMEDDYLLRIASGEPNTGSIKSFLSKGFYNSSDDEIITENFYDWMQEFPIPSDFKRTEAMEQGERRYLTNENWIKDNRSPDYGFSDITIFLV